MTELSIVIRTHNCRDTLRECLACLAAQTYRGAELIVVDSGSTDGTAEAARAGGARVLSVSGSAFTYGGTLNRGFAAASGRFLCSLSAHSLFLEPTFLERLVAALREAGPRVAAVYGCPVFEDGPARRAPAPEPDDRVTWQAFSKCCNLGLSNSCSIVRRELWEQHRFAPERCEDQKWAAYHLERGFETLCVRSARYRYRLNRSWRYYVCKHRDDFLMLHRAWPRADWPREELMDGPRVRYRFWCMLQRLRQVGWKWERLTDTQKWFATTELGLFWAGSLLRGGRLWALTGAADLLRALLLPAGRKGWEKPRGEWP
jgi:glycosyltransferase involved in cell wall biosynthesis